MSSNQELPAPEPAAQPEAKSETPSAAQPGPAKVTVKNQRPGLCCILPAVFLLLVFLALLTTLVMYLLDGYSVNDAEKTARKAAAANRSEWIQSNDAKAVYSLTGESSFVSNPDGGVFVMSLSSRDAGKIIELVPVEAGIFVMGSADSPRISKQNITNGKVELNTVLVSGPSRRVILTRDFLIGRTEVLKGQFAFFVEGSGYVTDAEKTGRPDTWRTAGSGHDDLPVVNVSWNDATEYVEWLNANDKKLPEGWEYRLPTEAEWEYACRAGTATKFAFGDSLDTRQANFHGRTGELVNQALPGGAYQANAWAISDMHGNVAEWCLDWYSPEYYAAGVDADPVGPANGEYRVVRGGGWKDDAEYCSSAQRNCALPGFSNGQTGFRVVLAQK